MSTPFSPLPTADAPTDTAAAPRVCSAATIAAAGRPAPYVTDLSTVNWSTQAVLEASHAQTLQSEPAVAGPSPSTSTAVDGDAVPHHGASHHRYFVFSRAYLTEQCTLVRLQLDALSAAAGGGDGSDDGPVPITLPPSVSAAALERVAAFLHYHVERPCLPVPAPMRRPWVEYVSEWDEAFVRHTLLNPTDRYDTRLLFEALNAATYLGCDALVRLTASFVSELLAGQSVQELRRLLHVPESARLPAEMEQEMLAEFRDVFPEQSALFGV